MNEDCEDEESFTRKPVTVGKEDKREGVSFESGRLAVDWLILERKVGSKRQYR